MNCTVCHYLETAVVKTFHEDDGTIKRRRECLKCGMRFSTSEAIKTPKHLKKSEYHNAK